jgi:hypothetical protein
MKSPNPFERIPDLEDTAKICRVPESRHRKERGGCFHFRNRNHHSQHRPYVVR